MSTIIGVIGAGNMGSAMVRGWLRDAAGAGKADVELVVWDKVEAAVERLLGPGPAVVERTAAVERMAVARSIDNLVACADVVLVVVKPKDAPELFAEMRPLLREGQMLISAMAGFTLQQVRGFVGPGPALVRIMPNLGVELGVGVIAVAGESEASATAMDLARALLEPLGVVESVPEELFDAVTAVAGSGPAFLALAIEGMEDGAVAAGLPRATARQAVRASALAVAQPQQPGADTAKVDDPGAESIRRSFRQAVAAAAKRSRQMQSAAAVSAGGQAPTAVADSADAADSAHRERDRGGDEGGRT